MLLLKSIRKHQDRSTMHRSSRLRSLSLRVGVFHPNTRTVNRLLGPCFKTGRLRPLRQHPSRSADLARGAPYCGKGYNTPRGELHSRSLYPAAPDDVGLRAASRPVRRPAEHRQQVWLQALPFQQFHVLFNSLSKVLFIFRSLYLCAIGLWPVFSFRRNLPPI
jgi:hypothetical protein